jgi:hypothetical protein
MRLLMKGVKQSYVRRTRKCDKRTLNWSNFRYHNYYIKIVYRYQISCMLYCNNIGKGLSINFYQYR